MSEKRKRRSWTATEKLRIVVAGLDGPVETSELCRREGINPTQYYGWKKQLMGSAGKAIWRLSKRVKQFTFYSFLHSISLDMIVTKLEETVKSGGFQVARVCDVHSYVTFDITVVVGSLAGPLGRSVLDSSFQSMHVAGSPNFSHVPMFFRFATVHGFGSPVAMQNGRETGRSWYEDKLHRAFVLRFASLSAIPNIAAKVNISEFGYEQETTKIAVSDILSSVLPKHLKDNLSNDPYSSVTQEYWAWEKATGVDDPTRPLRENGVAVIQKVVYDLAECLQIPQSTSVG